MLTYAPGAGFPPHDVTLIPAFAAWWVTRGGVFGVSVAVEPETTGMAQLQPHWPVDDLAKTTVLVVGVGVSAAQPLLWVRGFCATPC